jgi:hypothetical protein
VEKRENAEKTWALRHCTNSIENTLISLSINKRLRKHGFNSAANASLAHRHAEPRNDYRHRRMRQNVSEFNRRLSDAAMRRL